MKKIFTVMAAAMMAMSLSAASYGILVNGKTYFAGEMTGEFEGFYPVSGTCEYQGR